MLKPKPPVSMNVTLLRNRVFSNDQVKMRSSEWALIQQDCVLIKTENLDMEIEMQGECQSEGWSYTATRQRMQRLPANRQKLGQRRGRDCPSKLSEGTNPFNSLILNF